VYRPHNSSIIYRALESGDYGLEAFEGVCSDLLSLYGEVFILGDSNVDLLDPDHVLFEPFSDLLETFMLHNVAILPTRKVSGKPLDLFLVSVPAWSDHDMLFLSCRLGKWPNFTVVEDFEMLIKVS
jgi:hypothetical protein